MVNRWRKVAILVLTIALLAACDKSGGSTTSETGDSNPEHKRMLTASGKYEPPLSLTTVRKTIDGVKYQEGDSIDNNIWTRSFLEQYGIQVKNNWVIDESQYQQKINVSIVSSDLPDLFMVNSQQFQSLMNSGQIADLTDVFDTYASDLTKKFVSGGVLRQSSSKKGRLMAIPANGGSYDGAPLLWIRTDWLAKLGLKPPQTMDDVISIAKVFTEQDPDGNGRKDTFGLNLNKNLFDGYSGLEGFFGGYHAYPYNPTNGSGSQTMWLTDKEGNLVYGGIQPEVKTALGKLQQMFRSGYINPEFAVQDGTKASEAETSGKVGMHFGAHWNANWPLINTQKLDPKADWGVYPLVSADGDPARPIIANVAPSDFFVVNRNFEHPEAVIFMLNFYLEKIYGRTADEQFHIVTDGRDIYNVFTSSPIKGGMAENNQEAHEAVISALKSNNPSRLNLEQRGYYDSILKYNSGDKGQWWVMKDFGENGAFSVYGQYKKSNAFMVNAFYGPPTPTMIERGSTLRDLETVMLTKVIMGEPLDLFDKFVRDWKSQGGNQITTEVNAWKTSVK
ncbi:extracellular solute-binding protein [Paenibacillus sp. LMG 31461]|uniref:Extracellular solute-binding protein n=1 Tax=Paenibacillus plantarum TaxID=2654975 RepID=A0ABX1XLY6_9BACL|nr:extracellular solute-binding protein [Paenibacillus plantarum]NOU68873.1 extracellular solute-binding protein [Paenibacillus plantarum]